MYHHLNWKAKLRDILGKNDFVKLGFLSCFIEKEGDSDETWKIQTNHLSKLIELGNGLLIELANTMKTTAPTFPSKLGKTI